MGIHIELDNSKGLYSAGDVVEGRVIIRNSQPEKAKEVIITLIGNCRVHWTAQELTVIYPSQQQQLHRPGELRPQPIQEIKTVDYRSEEEYVSQKLSLFGDGEYSQIIPEGTTSYPFHFALKTSLPSSFKNLIGQVSYYLEAEIKRPFFAPNDRTRLPFNVNGIFDLNLEAGASLPQKQKRIQGSNCFACRTGSLNFVLKLPKRSGFTPGELLDFQVDITNASNQKVLETKAYLQQVVTFHAEGKSKTVNNIVGSVKGPEVDKAEHELWSPNSFKVPLIPPTRLGGTCRLIDLEYFLLFEMEISGLSDSMMGQLPVMIGTIPLTSSKGGGRRSSVNPVMPISKEGDDDDREAEAASSKQDKVSEQSWGPNGNVFITRASSAPYQGDYYQNNTGYVISESDAYKKIGPLHWFCIGFSIFIFILCLIISIVGVVITVNKHHNSFDHHKSTYPSGPLLSYPDSLNSSFNPNPNGNFSEN